MAKNNSKETNSNYESLYDFENVAQFVFVFENIVKHYKKADFVGLSEESEKAMESVKKISNKTGFGKKMVIESVQIHENALKLNLYGIGTDDLYYLEIHEVIKLRTEEGIKDSLKNCNLTKLYHALFPRELISQKLFNQAIQDNLDLYSVIKGFKYSLEYNKEDIGQKYEMEGRVFLALGKFDAAVKKFEQAIDECTVRFQNYHGDPLEKPSAKSFENDLPAILKAIFFDKLKLKQ